MIDWFDSTWRFVKGDYRDWPMRFALEVFAWALSIGCALIMAVTVPNPPLVYMYPFWMLGCSIYAWAAWTRHSFGMLANYLLLVTIDSVGLFRLLSNQV
jgi:hypothetical protein